MGDFSRIVKKNREFFSKQKKSLLDQKNIDLSVQNIQLVEVIEYIFWSNTTHKKQNTHATKK